MNFFKELFSRATDDYREITRTLAYEVAEEAGRVTVLDIYIVAVEAHTETEEMRYRKIQKHTQVDSLDFEHPLEVTLKSHLTGTKPPAYDYNRLSEVYEEPTAE